MAQATVLYRRDGPLAFITLNRPRAANGVNLELAQELRQLCQRARQDDTLRAVVLTGRGQAFSVGAALPPPGEGFASTPEAWLELHRAASSLAALQQPVVAAINGDALDQGLELALACDLRIAASGARLGLTHLLRGVLPWDGGTQRLPRIVGRARALELLLLGRVLEAQEALQMGLVHLVVEPDRLKAKARELALRLAQGAPIAARYTKEAVLQGMDLPLEQGMRLEADLNLILHSTADRREGIASFLEKRAPRF
ncbi:MAG: enoyl-CoA hydratase/isomerase family protein, partial [Dehalococcoidia bacterium]